MSGHHPGTVVAVNASATHTMIKPNQPSIRLLYKSGVMAIVLTGGEVRPGDAIHLELPAGEPLPLKPV